MDQDKTTYKFLSLPGMEQRDVPKKKFYDGINNKIIEPVEALPKNIYQICAAQYKKCINT